MAIEIAGMLIASALTNSAIDAGTNAAVAQANARERQTYEEMKRAQLGALQDHNNRISAFGEYEESVLLASRGRQDRSVSAILKSGKQASREELSAARTVALGQQSLLARQGDVARADRRAAIAMGRQQKMMNMINTGMKLYSVA